MADASRASGGNQAPEGIAIAPGFICEDWTRLRPRLAESREALLHEWPRAIDVVRSRIYTRLLDPVDRLRGLEYAGFAMLALGRLLIETLQAFRRGRHAATPEESREALRVFPTTTASFREHFTDELVADFYRFVRNGLLHDGETRRGWLV